MADYILFSCNTPTDSPKLYYLDNDCDMYGTDMSALAGHKARFQYPERHIILPEIISKEPLGPAIKYGDQRWSDITRWTVNVLFLAEELGITSQNVEDYIENIDPVIQRFMGERNGNTPETDNLGAKLGLAPNWSIEIIRQIGNYEEIYERHVGPNTDLGLKRGYNKLYTEGGLLYAPPLNSLLILFLIACEGQKEEDVKVTLNYEHQQSQPRYRTGARPVLTASHHINVRDVLEKYIYDSTVLNDSMTGTVLVPIDVNLEVEYKNYTFDHPKIHYESGVSDPFTVSFNSPPTRTVTISVDINPDYPVEEVETVDNETIETTVITILSWSDNFTRNVKPTQTQNKHIKIFGITHQVKPGIIYQ